MSFKTIKPLWRGRQYYSVTDAAALLAGFEPTSVVAGGEYFEDRETGLTDSEGITDVHAAMSLLTDAILAGSLPARLRHGAEPRHCAGLDQYMERARWQGEDVLLHESLTGDEFVIDPLPSWSLSLVKREDLAAWLEGMGWDATVFQPVSPAHAQRSPKPGAGDGTVMGEMDSYRWHEAYSLRVAAALICGFKPSAVTHSDQPHVQPDRKDADDEAYQAVLAGLVEAVRRETLRADVRLGGKHQLVRPIDPNATMVDRAALLDWLQSLRQFPPFFFPGGAATGLSGPAFTQTLPPGADAEVFHQVAGWKKDLSITTSKDRDGRALYLVTTPYGQRIAAFDGAGQQLPNPYIDELERVGDSHAEIYQALEAAKAEIEALRDRLEQERASEDGKPLSPRERTTYERLVYVLAREAGYRLEQPHAAEIALQKFAATIGATVPTGKGVIAGRLTTARRRFEQDREESEP